MEIKETQRTILKLQKESMSNKDPKISKQLEQLDGNLADSQRRFKRQKKVAEKASSACLEPIPSPSTPNEAVAYNPSSAQPDIQHLATAEPSYDTEDEELRLEVERELGEAACVIQVPLSLEGQGTITITITITLTLTLTVSILVIVATATTTPLLQSNPELPLRNHKCN